MACTTWRICSFASSMPPTSANRSDRHIANHCCCCTCRLRSWAAHGDRECSCFSLRISTEKSRRTKPPSPMGVNPKSRTQKQLRAALLLGLSARTGSQSQQNRQAKRNAAGHHELHGFLQDGWRIPQRTSQKADQHDRRKPQHRRVEEPFLRRLRHSITNRLARRLDWSSIASCAPPFQASTLADFRGSAQDTRVDAGMA